MERIYLTRDGYEKLVKELGRLKNIKRREIADALAHARSLGDLSENAEYDAAKEAFAYNEKKIKDLEERLAKSEIIEASSHTQEKAYLGSTVVLLDLGANEEVRYKLVGAEESDPAAGLISVVSPVGKALLGKAKGDTVEINVPAGVLKYKVIDITI